MVMKSVFNLDNLVIVQNKISSNLITTRRKFYSDRLFLSISCLFYDLFYQKCAQLGISNEKKGEKSKKQKQIGNECLLKLAKLVGGKTFSQACFRSRGGESLFTRRMKTRGFAPVYADKTLYYKFRVYEVIRYCKSCLLVSLIVNSFVRILENGSRRETTVGVGGIGGWRLWRM